MQGDCKAAEGEPWTCLCFLDDGKSMGGEELRKAVNFKPTSGDSSLISQYGEGLKMAAFHLKSSQGVRRHNKYSTCSAFLSRLPFGV